MRGTWEESRKGLWEDASTSSQHSLGEAGRELQRLLGGCFHFFPASPGMASAPSIKAGEPTEFTENPELWHLQDLKKDPSGHLSQPVNLHVVEPPQLTQQFAREGPCVVL